MKRDGLGRKWAIALCLAPFVTWGYDFTSDPLFGSPVRWAEKPAAAELLQPMQVLSASPRLPVSPSLPQPSVALASSPATCPAKVEPLIGLMLQDLPNYANRILRRSRILDDPEDDFSSTVIIAGNPEFEPLPLSPLDISQIDPLSKPNPTHQVFFTTLTRNYSSGKTYNTQNYYWMFLVQTESGWRLFSLLSSFGTSADGNPPSPPRESVNGVMGQAVKRWLRDCRAGSVRVERDR